MNEYKEYGIDIPEYFDGLKLFECITIEGSIDPKENVRNLFGKFRPNGNFVITSGDWISVLKYREATINIK